MRRFAQRDGMALLELVTALVIVSIGLFGVMQMYRLGVDTIRESQRRTVALRALDNEMETIRALAKEQLNEGRDLPWRSPLPALDVLPDVRGTVDILPVAHRPHLREVTAHIAWSEGRRQVARDVVTFVRVVP